MNPAVPRVHAVTNQQVATRKHLDHVARELGISPAVALHARNPHADGRLIYDLARIFTETRASLLINDRVDVAMLIDNAGVHLPSDGIPTQDARKLLAAHRLIGRSTHSPDEARRAIDDGADYVFLGPIWETASHPGRQPLGPAALRGLGFKVIAIGGVTGARAAQCRDAGAWGVAAISALWDAADPAAAVRAMLLSFESD